MYVVYHRALTYNNMESTVGVREGEDWSFNYLLQVSQMNFYSYISVGCLFIAKDWLEYNIFNYNLFFRRTNIESETNGRNYNITWKFISNNFVIEN
jgi:hypothetical protein